MRGLWVRAQISSKPAGLIWARSSRIPSRSHSCTSSRPKLVRPVAGEPLAAKIPPAAAAFSLAWVSRSEEHTSELQSQSNLVCRLLLEKKKEVHYHLNTATVWTDLLVLIGPLLLLVHLPPLIPLFLDHPR